MPIDESIDKALHIIAEKLGCSVEELIVTDHKFGVEPSETCTVEEVMFTVPVKYEEE